MSLAAEIVLCGASLWLIALIVATAYAHHQKRKQDELWVDALLARHRSALAQRYRNGQFREKSLWGKPR